MISIYEHENLVLNNSNIGYDIFDINSYIISELKDILNNYDNPE